MLSLFFFLNKRSPLGTSLIHFEQYRMACSLATDRHRPGFEGRHHRGLAESMKCTQVFCGREELCKQQISLASN